MFTAPPRHPFIPGRRRRIVAFSGVLAIVGCLTLFSLGGTASAGAGQVVPSGGRLAGETAGYWLKRSWQAGFDTSAPVDPCQWLSAHGQRVRYLTLATVAPGTDHYTCGEPAGQPTYVIGLSNECSTFHGDHSTFGTSDSALRKCARAGFRGVQQTTTIDGHPVDSRALIAGTDAFAVHAARHNILGVPVGDGRSAGYGYGLPLTGLPKGTHTIHLHATAGSATWDITYTVHVH